MRFVTLDAYLAAGGHVLRDLFESDDGGWLEDIALLDRLQTEKLDTEVAAIAAEGWKWIEAAVDFPYGHTYGMRPIDGDEQPASEEDEAHLEALREEADRLEDQWAGEDEIPDEVAARIQAIDEEIAPLVSKPLVYDAAEVAIAGTFVSIDVDGSLHIERGYVRPEDEPAEPVDETADEAGGDESCGEQLDDTIATDSESAPAEGAEEDDPDDLLRPLPDKLVTDLTAHRTLALRDAVASSPMVALAAMLHALVLKTFYTYSMSASCVGISMRSNRLAGYGTSLNDTASAKAIAERHESWSARLAHATPCNAGAVLHTVNPRFSDEQIVYSLNHAESRVLFFDSSFLPLVERLRSRLPAIETFILLAAQETSTFDSYEILIAREDDHYSWPELDENVAAALCYTSGTTGDPKGVLYSHRSIVLHALASGLSGSLGLSASDSVLICVQLYHATGWGLPFIAAINGCKIVLPCEKMDGASLHELIAGEGVTFTVGVPTIWTIYLDHLERSGEEAGTLERVVIGGSAVPRAMAEKFDSRYGVKVRQVWGMTELSPLGVISTPTPQIAALGDAAANEIIWTRQGRLQYGVELRVLDDDGNHLPFDGSTSGRLEARGPWTIQRYYKKDEDAASPDGWFDTGDIATIDEYGFMRITDRSKDVIKSGGEWISSIDLENVASACPGVKIAAAVGVHHPRWEERPILIVEAHDGAAITEQQVLDHLTPHVARWWLPDKVIFAAVPLTATGKIDKKRLRETHGQALVE